RGGDDRCGRDEKAQDGERGGETSGHGRSSRPRIVAGRATDAKSASLTPRGSTPSGAWAHRGTCSDPDWVRPGYSPITAQRNPIMMKNPLNKPSRPMPPYGELAPVWGTSWR